MDIISSTEYKMVVHTKGPKGQAAKTTQNGKFLKFDCN
jgi:cyanate lyase